MKITLGTVAAASLAAFAVSSGYGPSSAASRTACDLLTASQASAIVGSAVTAQGRPAHAGGSSVCLYRAGARMIAQFGLTVAENEAVATQIFKQQQQAAVRHTNIANRQKGNIVLSGITMNGDAQLLNRLLDAAAKNL